MTQTRPVLFPGISFSFILIVLLWQVIRMEINNPRLINCVPYHTGKFYICNKMSLILALTSLGPSHFLPIPRLCHTSLLPCHVSGWVSVMKKSLTSRTAKALCPSSLAHFPPMLCAEMSPVNRSQIMPSSPQLHTFAQSDVSSQNPPVHWLNINFFSRLLVSL